MEIQQLATNYKIDQSGVAVIRQSKIALLVGITSAGKDTIQKKLLTSPDYYSVISHTTRSPRENDGVLEVDGHSYHFVSFLEMTNLLSSHKMVEINKFGDNYYGVSVQEFAKANQLNKIAVTDIDVNGISSFYDIAPNNITPIFVVPPDYQTWRDRIMNRYSTVNLFESDWADRREIAISELQHALSVPYYHFIINDELDRAVKVTDKIIRQGSNEFNRGDDEARLIARDLLDSIQQNA